MQAYVALQEKYSISLTKINKEYNLISTLRLLMALVFVTSLVLYVPSESTPALICMLFSFVAFFVLIKIHQKLVWKKNLTKALLSINEEELAFLRRETNPFADGSEFVDHSHGYSYDLDIYGKNSLFQYLNRTATFMGKTKLSERLNAILPNALIKANQEAIQELSQKLAWRQDVLALSKVSSDGQEDFELLVKWASMPAPAISMVTLLFSYISPILFFASLGAYWAIDEGIWGQISILIFVVNLLVFTSQLKTIKKEMNSSSKIHGAIKKYSRIIESIENEKFHSSRLHKLKQSLSHNEVQVSKQVQKLAALFHRMDSLHNALGAIFSNGFLLYHIHVFRTLNTWKKEYASHIPTWLDVIAEFEALNSFANFSYNNPSFAFPKLNEQHLIELEDVGHPLIKAETRVNNSISFDQHRFIILTGSNMSGKSTFLRTLGVNMVLAGTGAPICASSANIHPMEVLVSMRLSDSLEESESYFFAEVKRLKEIMERLDFKTCFVLLDEILRGTNSDDKRSGTIGVIQKMISNKAIGAIATHDLEVCLTTQKHANILRNMCFEVEIVNDDLIFDYKLRSGICQNKSATFLMKKMGII